jgi:predicted RNase H-like HicB family nuclease
MTRGRISTTWNCSSPLSSGRSPKGYVGFAEELPGANTHETTLAETRANLPEAIALVLEANRTLAQEEASGPDVIREPITVSA